MNHHLGPARAIGIQELTSQVRAAMPAIHSLSAVLLNFLFPSVTFYECVSGSFAFVCAFVARLVWGPVYVLRPVSCRAFFIILFSYISKTPLFPYNFPAPVLTPSSFYVLVRPFYTLITPKIYRP